MKTIRRVAAASLIAATILAPLAAFARDCDDEHEHDRDERGRWEQRYDVQPGWVQPAPAPATWRDDGLVWDGRGWVRQGYDPRYDQQRSERFAEIRTLRFELRRLDDDRAAFVARWGWHPRKVARYDAWYLPRRAELQDRLDRLTAYAWR
ncbi:MAG TPA: hypothetical protein VFP50_05440 [Anaeromyxobacteraceae bacterium]|nr:hypothetical protein [Anaeromyxobacteraceae bacterium]